MQGERRLVDVVPTFLITNTSQDSLLEYMPQHDIYTPCHSILLCGCDTMLEFLPTAQISNSFKRLDCSIGRFSMADKEDRWLVLLEALRIQQQQKWKLSMKWMRSYAIQFSKSDQLKVYPSFNCDEEPTTRSQQPEDWGREAGGSLGGGGKLG